MLIIAAQQITNDKLLYGKLELTTGFASQTMVSHSIPVYTCSTLGSTSVPWFICLIVYSMKMQSLQQFLLSSTVVEGDGGKEGSGDQQNDAKSADDISHR